MATKKKAAAKRTKGKKINISFSTELIPKSDFTQELSARASKPEEGVFGIQEVQVGSEDFVVVFGRTHIHYK